MKGKGLSKGPHGHKHTTVTSVLNCVWWMAVLKVNIRRVYFSDPLWLPAQMYWNLNSFQLKLIILFFVKGALLDLPLEDELLRSEGKRCIKADGQTSPRSLHERGPKRPRLCRPQVFWLRQSTALSLKSSQTHTWGGRTRRRWTGPLQRYSEHTPCDRFAADRGAGTQLEEASWSDLQRKKRSVCNPAKSST